MNIISCLFGCWMYCRLLLVVILIGCVGRCDHVTDLKSLIYDYSSVIDLHVETDIIKYHNLISRFTTQLVHYSNHVISDSQLVDDSLICDVILSSSWLISNAIKDYFSSGQGITLEHDEIYQLAPWNLDLLRHILDNHFIIFNINSSVCLGEYTPLEYSVKLQNFNAVKLLLHHNAVLCMSHDPGGCGSSIQYATIQQNVELFQLLVTTLHHDEIISALCTASSFYTPYEISTHICSLSLGCDMYDIITDTINRMTNDTIMEHCDIRTPVIINSLLQNDDQYMISYIDSTGGWLKYDDDINNECQFPQLSLKDINVHNFAILANMSIPILIKDGLIESSLFVKWTRETLQNDYGNLSVLAGPIPYGEVFGEHFGMATINEFLQYMQQYNKEPINFSNVSFKAPLYIFDGEIINKSFKNLFILPGIFSNWNTTQYHQFILGPRGSGAPFHFHCNALNALVYGRKRWFLYPPGQSSYSKVHPLKWFIEEYEHLTQDKKPIECIQTSGDMLFVPSGWSHATLNIDECIGLAVEFDTLDC